MKTSLREFVFFAQKDATEAEFFYLEPVLKPSLKPDLPSEISMEVRRQIVQLENISVTSEIDQETLMDSYRLYGVDLKEETKSILANEMELCIEKKILEKIIESAESNTSGKKSKLEHFMSKYLGYEKRFNWKSPRDLVRRIVLETNKIKSESRCGGVNFIIVGPKVYSFICDSPDFTFYSINSTVSNPSFVYVGGQIGSSIKVLVDPKISFSNSKIYFGTAPDNSQARIFGVEGTEELIERKMPMDQNLRENIRITLVKRFGVKAIPSNYYSVVEIADFGKNHSLFTHFLSGMKSFFGKIFNPSFR